MQTRFSDSAIKNKGPDDFVVRTRRPLIIQLFMIFVIAFVAIYFTATIMSATGSRTIFFLTLTIIIGALGWFTIMFAMRNRDLVLATEFLNALLASAAQLSTRFCLIAHNDGSIIYIDPGFQKFFPNFMQGDGRTVAGLLAGAGVPEDQAGKIMEVLGKNQNARIVLPLLDANAKPAPTMVTIDPLPRPRGYLLLRGREYVEKRSGANQQQPDLASALLLAQAVYTLPEGVLIADGEGAITYVNQTLEEWLGYAPGEIMGAPLSFNKVFYQYEGGLAGRPLMDDYEGGVTLLRKDGKRIEMRVRQSMLRDGSQARGVSVVISPASADSKKN